MTVEKKMTAKVTDSPQQTPPAAKTLHFAVANSVTVTHGPRVHLHFRKLEEEPFELDLTPGQARYLASELCFGAATADCMKGFWDALRDPELREDILPAGGLRKLMHAMSRGRQKAAGETKGGENP